MVRAARGSDGASWGGCDYCVVVPYRNEVAIAVVRGFSLGQRGGRDSGGS